MSLEPGTTLGPYEVLSAIGAGGMGEVYKARDTKLDRDVALKILPDAFVNDPERLARFQREAKVLASLNHPNIAAIYGLEESGDSPALVLEYVPGPTLQDRIAKGPIPLDEALPIARQIAEALEAAHEQGIIHRDLKPANVKVKDDGTVKVLDFGLAKALQPELSDLDAANSPTMTMTAAATKMGVIMGTAAYMSPEQAAGKPVDRRSDLWAFGVVLWEMLTGRQLFTGETVSHILAAVLRADLDWGPLPKETPQSVRRLLRRCLERSRKLRLPDAAVARLEIDESEDRSDELSAGTTPVGQSAIWQRPLAVAAIAAAIAGVVAGLTVWNLTRPAPPRLARFPLQTLVDAPPTAVDLALSPDGRRIAYVAIVDGEQQLWVRELGEVDPYRLRGTGQAIFPFFSPDGNWVGYWGEGQLWKVPVDGGRPIALARSRGFGDATWGPDDTIIFSEFSGGGLLRVPAAGGETEPVTAVDEEATEITSHRHAEFLPGGEAVVFTIARGMATGVFDIAVLHLETGERTVLVRNGADASYSPTGHLVYGADGALMAVPFDLESLTVSGEPVLVLDGVATSNRGVSNFALGSDGSLVYLAGSAFAFGAANRILIWVDREGREEPLAMEPGAYFYPRISPDGTKVALDVRGDERDIFIWNFDRGTMSRLTFSPGVDRYPVWTPDGQRVVFGSTREGSQNLFWQAADGTGSPERLNESLDATSPMAVSADGTRVIFRRTTPEFSAGLHVLFLDGDRRVEPLLDSEFEELNADLSPDGRWIAYQSNESGQDEIYVRPFPNVEDGRWQVSTVCTSSSWTVTDGSSHSSTPSSRSSMPTSRPTGAGSRTSRTSRGRTRSTCARSPMSRTAGGRCRPAGGPRVAIRSGGRTAASCSTSG